MTDTSVQTLAADAAVLRAPGSNGKSQVSIDMLMDVPLVVTVELGRTRMSLRQALDLQSGSVIELDRLAGDPVDIFVNERMFARGEVVVVADKFAVRITELIPESGVGADHGGV
jgi:flagellar motor switch protein FliN/FliY